MSVEKPELHPRNLHRSRYDFPLLINSYPPLRSFVFVNPYGDESVDFSNPEAVKTLNAALLKHYYRIDHWDIPANYLCPPIPGRADYIHYLADLLAEFNGGTVPMGPQVKVLDIGVGANCIYPIIGHQTYRWKFVGSDVDRKAVESATNIAAINPSLKNELSFRLQSSTRHIFKGILRPGEQFAVTLCNPPFHASAEEAQQGSSRKVRNLGKQKGGRATLNFGGQHNELWCEGGELQFIRNMIAESAEMRNQSCWFSTLVSKSAHLPAIYHQLEQVGVADRRTVQMSQGQKQSRFVAWTFLSPLQMEDCCKKLNFKA